MELPKIETWLDLVATALVALAFIYTIIALFGFARAIRISAILIVTSLALFSDSFGTYFAAIFIVATAVTELEFLEKLAAIIRGSKEYFDYKTSQVPVAEAKAKANADAAAAIDEPLSEAFIAEPRFASVDQKPDANAGADAVISEQSSEPLAAEPKPRPRDLKPDADADAAAVICEGPHKPIAAEPKSAPVHQERDQGVSKNAPRRWRPSNDRMAVGYVIEQLTLTYLEGKFRVPIQRNLRFSRQGAMVEFDGVVEKGMGRPDMLIEVKLASARNFEDAALLGAKGLLRRTETFKEITGRKTTGIIVVVVPDKSRFDKSAAYIKSLIQTMSDTLDFELVDFKDIGYSSV